MATEPRNPSGGSRRTGARGTRTGRVCRITALCAAASLCWPGPRPGASQSTEYVVGPNDVLMVTVWNQSDLSGRFDVGADGAITFPLIGRVSAGGLTLREIESTLVSRLADGFFRNPEVSVTVESYRSQPFFVSGEVRQPGSYFLAGPETLTQALARAGSTTATASDEVLVIRPNTRRAAADGPLRPEDVAATEVIRVDLYRLRTGVLEGDIVLQAGDTVFVPQAESVYVVGQVKNPGAYPMRRSMTVLQVLSLAGGVTDRGASNRIRIVREDEGRSREVRVDLSDFVQPDDTIVVPERFF